MTPIDRDPHPVTHDLSVAGMKTPEDCEVLAEGLRAVKGILEVTTDCIHGKIRVTYDLHQVRVEDVEAVLDAIGYPPGAGMLPRLERELLHFIEENELDNMAYVPRSLNLPPHQA